MLCQARNFHGPPPAPRTRFLLASFGDASPVWMPSRAGRGAGSFDGAFGWARCIRAYMIYYYRHFEFGRTRMDGLKNKTALVTGGAQGIGWSVCRTLGEAGCHIIAADINEERLRSATAELAALGCSSSGIR